MLPRSEGELVKFGTWNVPTGILANPSTQTIVAGTNNPWNLTGAQISVMRLQPCVITKVFITSNGGAEWTSGTQQWLMWKNDGTRTPGNEVYDSGLLQVTDLPLVEGGQVQGWFDVNIPIDNEEDFLVATMDTVAVAGGPEGLSIELWGVTGPAALPIAPAGPAPSIITNANGTAWVYPDGRLICFDEDAALRTTSLAIGNVFRSSPWVVTFPVAFISIPVVIPGANYVSSTSLLGAGQAGPTSTTGTVLRINGSVISSQGYLNYVAIGAWK